MIVEKPSIWERKHGHFQTIRSSSLYSEEDYSQVEDIQNRHQEWTSQPIHPKIRACNAQRNGRTSPQASANLFNDKVHDSTLTKIWESMACLESLPEESLLPLLSEKAWQRGLGLQSYIWANHKTSRTMTFELMRPQWRCLDRMLWWKPKEHISTNTSSQKSSMLVEGWWFCACFVATGPGGVLQSIRKSIVRPSVR